MFANNLAIFGGFRIHEYEFVLNSARVKIIERILVKIR